MNKVFKVIWSKTKNCYVVASELAKSHTKAPSAKGISRVLVCGVLACVISCGIVAPAMAAGDASKISENSTAAVTGADVWEYLHTGSLALGKDSLAYSSYPNSISIGNHARTATTVSSSIDGIITIGNYAWSSNDVQVTVGSYATGVGKNSVAVGYGSKSGHYAVAIGNNATASNMNNPSLDYRAVAIGSESHAAKDDAVALGSKSVALANNVLSLGHKIGDTYEKRVVNSDGTASNGAAAYEASTYDDNYYRRIINMATGTETHDGAIVDQTGNKLVLDGKKLQLNNVLGTKLNEVDLSDISGASYTAGDGITISSSDAISAKAGTNVTINSNGINVVGGATVASGNTGLMTGANAYTELRPASNGTFVKTANTTKANLTALDTAAKNAIKGLSVSGSTLTYTKGDDSTGTVTIPAGKTYTAGNNIEISNTDVISASGNGTVTAGNTGLVTGNTVYEALQNIQVPEATQYTSGSHIMVGTDHSISALVDGTVSSGNTGLVSGGQVYDALQTIHPNVYIAGNGIVINGDDNSVSVKNVIMYDSDTQDTATLNGTRGTRLTNLKAANLTQASTDAVIGNQLWSVKEDITGFASDINRNKANITTLNQSVTDALSSVSAVSDLVDAIDSLKADASLNNLNNQGRAVIATAAADAVQAYMAEHSGDTGNTQARMMTRSLGAVNPGADTNYVVYDDADSTVITLEGPVGEGTKLTGLAEAELSASSTDAVTGSQLYATEQKFNEFQSALSENNSTIATMQTSVNTLKTKTLTMESDLNTAKTQLETGFNVTIGGAKVKTVNPDNNVINFVAGDNVTLTDDNGSIKISATGGTGGDTSNLANKDASNVAENTADWGAAIGTGAVEAGNGELVTGGTVFEAVNDAVAGLQDELAGKANTDMDNLTDTGKQNVKDLAKEAVKVKGSGAVTVTSTEENGATVYDVSVAADGKVEAGDTGIVTGGAVYDALTEQEQMITDKLDGKADKDAVYTKDETDAKLADKADKADLDAKADKSELDKKADKADLDNKANKDASNIEIGKWADKLGVGAVEEGDGNLVTGDTVAKALAEIDGTDLINQNGEAIQIGAKAKYDGLDSVDISKSDGSGRVLRGVLVDPDDDTSAANVGYVKAVGEAISQGVNAGFQKMDDKINKTGAGAAALANLHPVDTDGDTKLNIAAGIGRYHGETAGALGLFYKPSERVVMNISSTIGNSDTMFGAGVSVAVDKPVAGGMSKAQLVKAVNAQAERIEQQDAKIQRQDAVNEALVAEIQQMKAEIAKLKAGNK